MSLTPSKVTSTSTEQVGCDTQTSQDLPFVDLRPLPQQPDEAKAAEPQQLVRSFLEKSGSTTHNPYSLAGSMHSFRLIDSPPLTPRGSQDDENPQQPSSKSLAPQSTGDNTGAQPFSKGFHFGLYNQGSTQYYQVPSEHVVPTKGSQKYIEQYNSYGASLRFRYQLCHKFLTGKCERGADCPYVHVTSLGAASTVHLNNPESAVGKADTLPAGVVLYVHPPGTITAPPQAIPSEFLLRTTGSITVYDAVVNNTVCSIIRPQHCAHFQFKRVCNRGHSCNFIHSLVPLQSPRPTQSYSPDK